MLSCNDETRNQPIKQNKQNEAKACKTIDHIIFASNTNHTLRSIIRGGKFENGAASFCLGLGCLPRRCRHRRCARARARSNQLS